jgi:hypothetical protein
MVASSAILFLAHCLIRGPKTGKSLGMSLRLWTRCSITSETQHNEQSQVLLEVQGPVTYQNITQPNVITDRTGIGVHTVVCTVECLRWTQM